MTLRRFRQWLLAGSLCALMMLMPVAAQATEPLAWEITPTIMQQQHSLKNAHLVDMGAGRQAMECDGAVALEMYGLQAHLSQGWWRVILLVRPDRAAQADDRLEFSLWNPYGSPGSFNFTTVLAPGEFGPGDKSVAIARQLYVGPDNGNLGMYLRGGWKGLQLDGIRFEPLPDALFVQSVQADRLVYGMQESGTLRVALQNSAPTPQRARLIVEIEAGLNPATTLTDQEIEIPPAGAVAHNVTVKLPPQPEYGHQLRAVLRRPGPNGEILGEARDWFFVSDKPVRIGQLGAWPSAQNYVPQGEEQFVADFRRKCFPLVEMPFWAPDDYMRLIPPEGKDRWWSGQTLAQLSTQTIKARIAALHNQGMRALGYTDLRISFGFRVAELFRRHPEWCHWDANDEAMAFSPVDTARQAREDDSERFDPANPNKSRFGASGVFTVMTGNPAAVDYHIHQLVAAVNYFDWDGFRYDDYCDYDFPATDMLGNHVPYKGFTVPVLTARTRAALELAKPGIIYGRNMEWTPRIGKGSGGAWVTQSGGDSMLETPMPLDTLPMPGDDYYTEHLRNDGLEMQERVTAYWGDGARWEDIAEKLNRFGQNAARRGGHAYAITPSHNYAIDGRTMAALLFASRVHMAYWASEWQVPYLRLAARHCDLIYGDTLQPAPRDMLTVEARGGREPWWKRYVRVAEPAPGKRIYLVHLINPPVKPTVDTKNMLPPPPATDLALTWTLPAGWKAVRAWQLSADNGEGLETSITRAPKIERVAVTYGSEPRRELLPLRVAAGRATVTVPSVLQWSIIALECSGPTTDRLPAWRFPLPPSPTQPRQCTTTPVTVPVSPNRLIPVVISGRHPSWQHNNAGKREPLSRVPDASSADGMAVQVQAPLYQETYFSGIHGGRYRFSVRMKTLAVPPADAKLHLRCWAAYQAWVLEQDLPLAALVPGTWTEVTLEATIGDDHGNCGVSITGGWDGLLIDRLEIRELQPELETTNFTEQKLRPWPAGLAPAADGHAWCLRGLWQEFFGLDAAMKACGIAADNSDWWTWRERRGWSGPQIKTPEELAKYRLVVLANIDLRSLSLEQRAWLKGWVEVGGSLLMTGGPYALGRGWWQDSDILASIMPATLKPYDLQPAAGPLLLQGAGPLAALTLPGNASTVWLHELAPKPGVQVALTAGGQPALILGEAGKGRVALLALAPLGEDIPGAWWRSDTGVKISEAACRWLLRQPAHDLH